MMHVKGRSGGGLDPMVRVTYLASSKRSRAKPVRVTGAIHKGAGTSPIFRNERLDATLSGKEITMQLEVFHGRVLRPSLPVGSATVHLARLTRSIGKSRWFQLYAAAPGAAAAAGAGGGPRTVGRVRATVDWTPPLVLTVLKARLQGEAAADYARRGGVASAPPPLYVKVRSMGQKHRTVSAPSPAPEFARQSFHAHVAKKGHVIRAEVEAGRREEPTDVTVELWRDGGLLRRSRVGSALVPAEYLWDAANTAPVRFSMRAPGAPLGSPPVGEVVLSVLMYGDDPEDLRKSERKAREARRAGRLPEAPPARRRDRGGAAAAAASEQKRKKRKGVPAKQRQASVIEAAAAVRKAYRKGGSVAGGGSGDKKKKPTAKRKEKAKEKKKKKKRSTEKDEPEKKKRQEPAVGDELEALRIDGDSSDGMDMPDMSVQDAAEPAAAAAPPPAAYRRRRDNTTREARADDGGDNSDAAARRRRLASRLQARRSGGNEPSSSSDSSSASSDDSDSSDLQLG